MTRLRAAAVVLLLAACDASQSSATGPSIASAAPRPRISTLDGPAPLRDEFVKAAGAPRLVLFLSPT